MRLRSIGYGAGLLVLLMIFGGVALAVFGDRPMRMAIGVYSYERQGDELAACLALTNTGAISLVVPLRFVCEVDRLSGLTNYTVNTPYSVFLKPGQHVVLSSPPWRVRLPTDATDWRVNVRARRFGGREKLVDALRKSGFVNPRLLSRISRLAGPPNEAGEYKWLNFGSSSFEVRPGGRDLTP